MVNYGLGRNGHHNLGAAFTKRNYYDKVKEYQEKKVEIDIGDSGLERITFFRQNSMSKTESNLANFYSNLSIIYAESGNYKKALELQKSTSKIWTKLLKKHHPNVVKTNYNIALLYEALNDIENAGLLWNTIIPSSMNRLNDFYLFLSDKQRLDYLKNLNLIHNEFYAFTARHGDTEMKQLATNLSLNNKALILDYSVSIRKFIRASNDEELIELMNDFRKINQQIIPAEIMTAEELKHREINLNKLIRKRDNLYAQMLKHEKLKAKLSKTTVEWQEIQRKIKPDEIVLDFLTFYNTKDTTQAYYATLIRKYMPNPQFITITDKKTIHALFEADEMTGQPRYLSKKGRKELYQKIWQPLKPYLEGITSVHLSPSGLLHKVDFEVLQNTDNQYLADDIAFHYHSTLRDFIKQKTKNNIYKDAVLMGHILYDMKDSLNYKEAQDEFVIRDARSKIKPLPATLEEVKAIAEICTQSNTQPILLTIDAATEDIVQSFSGNYSPNILHFATHGASLESSESGKIKGTRDRLRAADNPLQRSVLMLYGANHAWAKSEPISGSKEDGILTALEVTALDLQNTKLVVLSACSSGLGNVHNTEGVFGLQRAFKLAGVDYVVASLWAVDDNATKDLMVIFYKNLLQKKQDPATALRNAKETLRKREYMLRDWAGFILIE